MHLLESEFWDLTLAQFDALAKRHHDEQDWLNFRPALICSVLANIYRDRKKKSKPFTPEDFMPKKAQQSKGLTPDQMLNNFIILNASMGGDYVEN